MSRHELIVAVVLSILVAPMTGRAQQTGTVVVQPAPGPSAPPAWGPPVLVVPGRPTPPPPPVVVVPVPTLVPVPPGAPAQASVSPSGTALVGPTEDAFIIPPPPEPPAPGTFGAGFVGTWDGTDLLFGGHLRFTGHLADRLWFLEGSLGGNGGRTPTRDIGEFAFLLGPRVMAPIVPSILRLYAALATGILIRSIGDRQTWGILPVQLGGGMELGVPLSEHLSLGFWLDVRAEARIPFERDPATLGLVYGAGIGMLWF